MTSKITVIDLFAGPGGLGEGFSSFKNQNHEHTFKIALSVEKEANAHKTLELRSFFRQFNGEAPEDYYQYLKGELDRDTLFQRYPSEARAAAMETLAGPREMGKREDDAVIREYLENLKGVDGPKVVIGGPPCQAYSLVGRSRNRGIKGYSAKKDARHFLYREYLRVLHAVQPEVFIMENVKGILSSRVDGNSIFGSVLQDLEDPGSALGLKKSKRYRIFSLSEEAERDLFDPVPRNSDYVIRSEEFGIPQARHRVILLGIEEAQYHNFTGAMEKNPKQLNTESVLYDLPVIRSGLTPASADSSEAWARLVRKASQQVKKEFCKIDLVNSGLEKYAEMAGKIKSRGAPFIKRTKNFSKSNPLKTWFEDERLSGFTNHMSRGHKPDDLVRYFFCSSYALQNGGASAKAADFPAPLKPNHKNWDSGIFVDRFKVQAKNKCASTITSHIAKDGHYYIHYDPSQCRSLTVREAARLQTFPDNYFFEGYQTAQYVQVGNAVPPYLAAQIASKVYEILSV